MAALSQHTRDFYAPKLRDFLAFVGEDTPIEAINEMVIDLYVSSLYDPRILNPNNNFSGGKIGNYKPATITNHVRALRSFFGWLRKKRHISINPTEVIDLPPLPVRPIQPIPEADLIKLLSICELRDRVIVSILAYTGLRVGELCDMEREHIDLGNRVIFVPRGKGDKFRYVPISELLKSLLTVWLLIAPDYGPVVGLLPNGVRLMLQRRCADAGIDYYHPHQFRHYFATSMVNAGCGVAWLQLVLGHEIGSKATNIYVHSDIRGIVAEFDRLTI